MWSLKNGEEITRTIRNEDVLSFALSPDGTLLAISHFSGLVCLVDALNCLETTLAEFTTSQPCGMIKFTLDMQLLFCWSSPFTGVSWSNLRFPLNVVKLPSGTFSLNVLNNDRVYDPRDDELSSKGGFLMGDPVIFTYGILGGFAFVLNNQSLLRVRDGNWKITMLKHEDYLRPHYRYSYSPKIIRIAFALDGKTIYCVILEYNSSQVVSLDVSSGRRKAEKPVSAAGVLLVPVSEGVLLKETEPESSYGQREPVDVQLWNFELSQQIRSWPNLSEVRDIKPFSDRCVACMGRDFQVSILDTSNGNIVKTIPLCHEGFRSTHPQLGKEAAIVCNSKFQLLSTSSSSVQLSDGKNELWKRNLPWRHRLPYLSLPGMFSPTEEFVLVSSRNSQSKEEVLVLEASSGKHLWMLCTIYEILDCAFVSKTECVIVCRNTSESYYCLPLFNVSTGDFLTVLDIDHEPSVWLASCPQKGLIAFGLENSKCMYVVIEVKLPRDKVNREAKGEQCVFFLSLVEVYVASTITPTLNWQY